MFSITTNKIAGLTPRWARFPGFSLLFDPPSSALSSDGGLEFLDGDWELGSFFSLAEQGLHTLGLDRLLQTYGFCALPSASYHVTAFDVANVADLRRCRADVRDSLNLTFETLPAVEALDAGFLVSAVSSELATKAWNLTFEYGGLRRWGSVMAIELLPQDDAQFQAFLSARASLSRRYREAYGVGADESYTPHLSLGYFMNREGSEMAAVRVAEWDDHLRNTLGPAVVTLATALRTWRHSFDGRGELARIGGPVPQESKLRFKGRG